MKAIFLIFIILNLSSCASQKEEREINARAQETKVTDSKGLGNTISDLIQSSKTLSDVQKKELMDIMALNKKRADSLTEQSYKFRAVLIKELLSGNVHKTEIDVIKKDIAEIEAARLKNTFDTVNKITNIVSAHPEKDKFVDHLINFERPFR
jgi:hypothetical protein